MPARHTRRRPQITPHSKLPAAFLKLLLTLVAIPCAFGQARETPGDHALRAELTRMIAEGHVAEAVQHAQQTLENRPGDAGVRGEYVRLHQTLADEWLRQRRFGECLVALEAVLDVEPEHPRARSLRNQILAARTRAGGQLREIDLLLRLERFEDALDRIRSVKALAPALHPQLTIRERSAWLGAADDHYLARNFNEAFALYEHVLTNNPKVPRPVNTRWGISLALALSEADGGRQADENAPRRLLKRTVAVLKDTGQTSLALVITGLLAEQAEQTLDAGGAYARALGETWTLPSAEERAARVHSLRVRAITLIRGLYEQTPTQRRDGIWSLTLPGAWKRHETSHFDVYARNDVVAARVAEAAEYHLRELSWWLGLTPSEQWHPRCEIRVYASRKELAEGMGLHGIGFAVSKSRLRGSRIVSRELGVFQADPWLLASTLPHELTHLLITEHYRDRTLPLAIDEGLAVHAEPPARRLMYRRLLPPKPLDVTRLMSATAPTGSQESFYAQSHALVDWLMVETGHCDMNATEPGIHLLDAFTQGERKQWWRMLNKERLEGARSAWRRWHENRPPPQRMPLMILTETGPAAPGTKTQSGKHE